MIRITDKKLNKILKEILDNKVLYSHTSSMIGDMNGNIIFCFGDSEYTKKIMKYYTSHKIKYYYISIIPEAEIINGNLKSTDIIYYYICYDDTDKYILITKKQIGYNLGDVVLYEYNICSA